MSYESSVQLGTFPRFSNNTTENNHYVSEFQARQKRGVLVILLFSRLYNMSTSTCVHFAIMQSFSSNCFYRSNLLPLIPN
jgi:hypothetical protein